LLASDDSAIYQWEPPIALVADASGKAPTIEAVEKAIISCLSEVFGEL